MFHRVDSATGNLLPTRSRAFHRPSGTILDVKRVVVVVVTVECRCSKARRQLEVEAFPRRPMARLWPSLAMNHARAWMECEDVD